MSRKLTLLLLLLTVLLPLFAQNMDEAARARTVFPPDFWQSKQGITYIRKNAYKNKITLSVRFRQELTAAQNYLLETYGGEKIGYRGNGFYLMRFPAEALTKVQALPFVAEIVDFDVLSKATPEFWEAVPAEAKQSKSEVWIDVLTVPQSTRKDIENNLPAGAQLLHYFPDFQLARINIAKKNIRKLLEKPWVLWADYVMPDELNNQFGVTTTRAGSLQFHLPQLTGKGVNVGVWDGSAWIGPHVDFVNRTSQEEPLMGEPFSWREHATHVSGTLASAGLRFIYGRGIAPEAKLFNYNIVSTGTAEGYIPFKMLKAAEQHGIVITQNSYGPSHTCGSGGILYSTTNRSQDLVANAFPELLHVFAAGNNGGACGGYYNTVNGAKNIISVASLNAADQRMWLAFMQSAGGPTRDGRLQPHIAAPGVDIFSTTPDHFYASSGWSGTSMAAPHVSGIAALLYQRYRELNGGQTPAAALIRAVLLNSANDLGNPGPDYVFGYGKVNAVNAAAAITENRFLTNSVAQSQINTHYINVPSGSRELKVMLSWNDPAALPGASPALVNNLNLQAKSPSGTIVLPLVLNPAAPTSVAVQGVDNRNNNEQVVVSLPESGIWEITVTGASIAMGSEQSYALTWQSEGEFLALRNPTTTERDISPVHWDSRGIMGNVTVEFFDGSSWATLGSVPASQGRFNWTPPAIVTDNARIRISATGESGALFSETSPPLLFLGVPNITPNPNITPYTAGNNSLTFSWSAALGADAYEILWLNLQKGAWEVIATVPPTTTTYTVTGLENGVRHWLSVRTRNNTLNASSIFAYAGFGTPTGAGASQDIELVQITHQIPPGSCLAPMQPLQVLITLRNKGTNPIPAGTVIPVSYRINNGTWVSEDFTLSAELAVNQMVAYTFTQTFTPSAIGEVSIEAQNSWAADMIFTNNSRIATVQIPPAPLPIVSAMPGLSSCTVPTLVRIDNIPDDGYQLGAIAFGTEDMSGATEITISDDGVSGAVPIGFPFRFYNNSFENVYISAEGFITFRSIDFDYINFLQRAIPNTLLVNDFIALAWNNMSFVAGSKIRYQTFGTAPQRKFVVEFLDMAQKNDNSKRLSGQIMLYESFNRIELHIARLDASPLASIIAGIENREGTIGLALPNMNNQSIPSDIINQAWAFTPVVNNFTWLDNSSTSTVRLFTAAGTYRFRYERNGCVIEQNVDVCNNADVPAIASIADVITPEDVAVSVPVAITYGTLSETLLTITQTSNNPSLIPDANLVWVGTGTSRQLQITPLPNQNGVAQITVTATDGINTAARTFQVTVTPVNDLPVVSPFSLDLFENSLRYFNTTMFITRYSDVEGLPMASVKIVTLPANGQLLFNGMPIIAGTIIPAAQLPLLAYKPNLHFLGTDSFQWTASDGTDFADVPALVNLRISKRPELILPVPTIDAIADVTTQEDTPVSVPVRINYGDLSDELLTIWVFADDYTLLPVSSFRWTGSNTTRRLIITPAANRFGSTQVTIVVSNGRNGTVKKFNIHVQPVNDAPVIASSVIRVKSGRDFAFTAAFFDSLYRDIENEVLAQVRITQLPRNGRLRIGERPITEAPVVLSRDLTGRLIYEPSQGFTGDDGFEWQASDGTDFSNAAQARVQVWNTPPQASTFTKRIHWRQTLSLSYADWLAAFTDPDGDLPAAVQLMGDVQPQQWLYNNRPIVAGMPLPLDRSTVIAFRPERATGTLRLFWNVSDGTTWADNFAELNIIVRNTPPSIQDFSLEGTGDIRFAAQQFQAAYADADNDPMETVRITALPQFGQLLWQGLPLSEPVTLAITQLNELRYIPRNTAQPQPDRIGWQASDGVDVSNAAVIHLNVQPVMLPQVSSFSREVTENQTYSFSSADFASSYDYRNEQPEFIRILSLPAYGTLRIGSTPVTAGNTYTMREAAQLSYQPFREFIGTDGFLFTAGAGAVTAATPAMVMLQVHLAPISAPQNLRFAANRLSWQQPLQGNIRQYEVQAQIIGSETLVIQTFTAEENFLLPAELMQVNIRFRVRAWGYHNNAGPFTEWLNRPLEVVANLPDVIATPYPMLKLFPNPALAYIFLQWRNMPGAQVRITDNLGRVLQEWQLQEAAGMQRIDIQSLSAGVYHVQALYAGQRYIRSFLVVK